MADQTSPSQPPPAASAARARSVRRTALICTATVFGMVGMSFAAVPLYRLFCQVTGFGGTPQIGTGPAGSLGQRVVSVRFDANVSPGISWRFAPDEPEVEARVGETKTVFYKITNTSKVPTTGIATFNVQPEQAGAFFVKIQCFCFSEQTLAPGETIEAPVVFYIDPEIETSPDLKGVTTITLSYTVFPAKNGQPVAATRDATDKTKL